MPARCATSSHSPRRRPRGRCSRARRLRPTRRSCARCTSRWSDERRDHATAIDRGRGSARARGRERRQSGRAREAAGRARVAAGRHLDAARPAVEAGESLGFLPGDVQEKVDPYLRPLYDALEDMMPRDRVQKAIDSRTIEIAPLAYMRGRTLSDAFVILDEAQNATGMQMKMFLTRLGVNSRAVITGDKTQIDLVNREDSGLLQVERILPGIEGIGFCYLTDADVVRHRLVRDIIRAYAEDAQG